jgi:apolipoprotein N-acyltransferase
MVEPFAQTYLIGDIPVRDTIKKTVYTRAGDWFGVLASCAALAAIIIGIVLKGRNYVQAHHQ